jgi:hypothetical protein
MPTWLSILLLVLGIVALAFIASGVLPRYRKARGRLRRVNEFLTNYGAFSQGDQAKGPWLAARSAQMQRDAESVGQGVGYVAPPPMFGGGYLPHPMFADLFNRQSFTDDVTPEVRVQVLLTTLHDLQTREDQRRSELLNPLQWVRLAFERIVGFPRYLLRVAGFSEKVTESRRARIFTLIWAAAVGLAGIGSFVVAIIRLAHGS